MASFTVQIRTTGAFDPPSLLLMPGDVVTYKAPSAKEMNPGDVVILCVYPAFIYGDTRYVIPPDQSVTVEVMPKASGQRFTTIAHFGSIETECRPYEQHGTDPNEPGGGEVGGDDVPDGEP